MRTIRVSIKAEDLKKKLNIKDGSDYVLTEQDKIDIASSIKPSTNTVTEIVREIPIITEVVKEVALHETGTDIVDKINSLDERNEDEKIDARHIKNLPPQVVRNFFGGSYKSLADIDGVNQFELQFNTKIGYNSYMEYTEVGGLITQVNYWKDSLKTFKLFTKDITYSSGNPTVVTTTDSISLNKLVKTIAYDGSWKIISVTKVII